MHGAVEVMEISMTDDFRQTIRAFADRAVAKAPHCTTEEATKQFLVLPFVNLLGYDIGDPSEVRPEHNADFSEKYKNRVDYAILRSGQPVIAVECKTCGMQLRDERGQLRSYFNAAETVKLGVITDGLIYEFYADSDKPNMMDVSAFLTLDLREVAKGKIEDSVDEGLRGLLKKSFDPENIGAKAKQKLIFQKFVSQITKLAEDPNEAFVKLLLEGAGVKYVRLKSSTEFTDLTRAAFREFINFRILQRLDLPTSEIDSEKTTPAAEIVALATDAGQNAELTPSPIDLKTIEYIKQRLAYLVKDDTLFREIEHLHHRKYARKLVVYYKRERAGRLLDFYEGRGGKSMFDFGQDGGEVKPEKLPDIDTFLLAAFKKRVAEGEGAASHRKPTADAPDVRL